MSSDLNTLIELKNKMESKETALAASNALVSNPAKEVENSLKNFVTSRLDRIESDAQFGDLVKMHIRQRLPEFSVDQLLQLNDQVARNNNRAVEGMVPLFQGDSGGKIITEHLNDTTVSSTAQNLYDSASGDMLQAVSYLNSVLSKLSNKNVINAEAEVIEENSTN